MTILNKTELHFQLIQLKDKIPDLRRAINGYVSKAAVNIATDVEFDYSLFTDSTQYTSLNYNLYYNEPIFNTEIFAWKTTRSILYFCRGELFIKKYNGAVKNNINKNKIIKQIESRIMEVIKQCVHFDNFTISKDSYNYDYFMKLLLLL